MSSAEYDNVTKNLSIRGHVIGVLALQGAFMEHVHALQSCAGVRKVVLVKSADDLSPPNQEDALDALVLPGGESTTMGLVARRNGLLEPLRQWISQEKPVFATCAGLIMLADQVTATKKGGQECIGGLHVSVKRNAFGHQIDSFVTSIHFDFLEKPEVPFHSVFIRAPIIERVLSEDVQVIASIPFASKNSSQESSEEKAEDRIIAVRQNKILALSFHPELTRDNRFHQYFVSHFL